jgi:hypothetical protein
LSSQERAAKVITALPPLCSSKEYLGVQNSGYEVLNSVPAVLKEKKTLGEQISRVLKDRSKELIKSLVLQAVHKGIETWSAS